MTKSQYIQAYELIKNLILPKKSMEYNFILIMKEIDQKPAISTDQKCRLFGAIKSSKKFIDEGHYKNQSQQVQLYSQNYIKSMGNKGLVIIEVLVIISPLIQLLKKTNQIQSNNLESHSNQKVDANISKERQRAIPHQKLRHQMDQIEPKQSQITKDVRQSSSIEPIISIDNPTSLNEKQIQDLLAKAVHYERGKNLRQSEQIYRTVILWANSNDLLEKGQVLAYAYSALATNLAQQNGPQYKSQLQKVQDIYESNRSKYIEEHITLLSNIGSLEYQHTKYKEAKEHLEKALQLSKTYYTITDERKYYIINNLMCLYFQTNDTISAQALYHTSGSEFKKYSNQTLRDPQEIIQSNFKYRSQKPFEKRSQIQATRASPSEIQSS